MYYIQRLKQQTRLDKTGLDRILFHDYMGSVEFECGAIPKSWTCLKYKFRFDEHVFQSTGGKALQVLMYIIHTDCLQYAVDHIEHQLDGSVIGRKAKEWTGIWDKFNSTETRLDIQFPDGWLDVSDCVIYREGKTVFFTDNKFFADSVLLTLLRNKYSVEETYRNHMMIGDSILVVTPERGMFQTTVLGFNENDVTVRDTGGKKRVRVPHHLGMPTTLITHGDFKIC